jgi:hypothetical protein
MNFLKPFAVPISAFDRTKIFLQPVVNRHVAHLKLFHRIAREKQFTRFLPVPCGLRIGTRLYSVLCKLRQRLSLKCPRFWAHLFTIPVKTGLITQQFNTVAT